MIVIKKKLGQYEAFDKMRVISIIIDQWQKYKLGEKIDLRFQDSEGKTQKSMMCTVNGEKLVYPHKDGSVDYIILRLKKIA